MILEQSVTLLAFCCLIAVCSAIHDPLPSTNPVKLSPAEFQKNIQQELCIRKAQLYRECSFSKESIVQEIKKETGNNLALTRGAQAISVPIGCKATLYNEQRHFAIHIRGPKNYCSEINTLGSIDMVRLEDSAGIASLESELVKTEKTLEGYKRDMDYFEKKVTSTAIELRNIPGPKGPTGTQGLTVRGELGERGAKGPAGLKGPKGHIGAHGNQGSSGLRGVQGLKGKNGERGIKGIDGDPFQGPRGPRGDPGVSLTYQTFEFDKDFRKGEYVFSKNSSTSKHDSLFIAKKLFHSGKKFPYEDKDNWEKFVAPHGIEGTDGIAVIGPKGEKGEKGDQGEAGEDGKVVPCSRPANDASWVKHPKCEEAEKKAKEEAEKKAAEEAKKEEDKKKEEEGHKKAAEEAKKEEDKKKCGKDIKWERYFDLSSGPAWTWDCYDNCRAREEHSQEDIDTCLPELIGQTFPTPNDPGFTMRIDTINRDWDKKKGCCADGCPPNLHKWWLYHRGRTQQWHWSCSDVRYAVGPPHMVASGEKTTVPCIDRLIRCAIVGKRTGEESRKKPAYQKWCRPFGPDIRDANSHSVTNINRNWNKRGTCDRRRRRRRRRLK